jgi:ribose 5-phosphate isomerase B
MKILISSDHAGFELKNILSAYVENLGHSVLDLGPVEYDESDDYPDLIAPLASKISSSGENTNHLLGIIIGGSGQGEAIVANRFSGVRAGILNCENLELVTLMRQHNDANIISIGARFVSPEIARQAIKLFIETAFSRDTRHERRIKEIDIECK